MIFKCLIVVCFLVFYIALVLPPIFDVSVAAKNNIYTEENVEKPYFLDKPFPSFLPEYAPTEWWIQQNKKEPQNYPIFKLSQNYPVFKFNDKENFPVNYPEKLSLTWEKTEFDKVFDTKIPADERWDSGKKYLIEVLKYAYKENITLDGNIENDWNPAKDNPKWFHAPWLHANKKTSGKDRGREFVHGLTAERCSCRDELKGKSFCEDFETDNKEITNNACENALEKIQNWGVAVFNDLGGFNVGRIWEEMTVFERKSDYPNPARFTEMDFPYGSVIVKLLFTSATDKDADFLKGSNLEWKTDLNRVRKLGKFGEPEVFPKLRLLQIDIAVRDKRADEFSGWVFGTFAYHPKTNSSSEIGKFNGWENVEPVGLMFGNDPNISTTRFQELRESLINPNLAKSQHLGCGQRLNGAVDNPKSSCLACHAQQSEVQKSKIKGVDVNFTEIQYKIGSPSCDIWNDKVDQCDLAYWFKNVSPKQTFSRNTTDKSYFTLHNVIQLEMGFKRYCDKYPDNCRKPSKDEKINEIIEKTPFMNEGLRGRN